MIWPNNIPRNAFFYWGGKNVSYLRYISILSFLKNHSNFNVSLYTPKYLHETITWTTQEQKARSGGKNYIDLLYSLPEKFDNFKIIEVDLEEIGFRNNVSEVHKSDVLRWFLLFTYGGVWVDADIIFLKSLEDIDYLKENTDTVVSIMSFHSIGLLFSSKDNELFSFVFKKSIELYDPSKYQSAGSVILDRYFRTMDKLVESFKNLNIINLKKETIYQIDSHQIPMFLSNNFDIKETNIGFHWYGGAPMISNYENQIDDNNYMHVDVFLSKLIKLVNERN